MKRPIIVTVPTLNDAKNITPETGLKNVGSIYIKGRTSTNDGYQGHFYWDSSDNSTNVTNDTQNGIYIPPNSDTTGASGVWVRQYDGTANLLWFGAIGDGSTVNTTAIQAALNFDKPIFVPSGTFLTGAITYTGTQALRIFGESRDKDSGSIIKFTGTLTDGLLYNGSGASQGCDFEDISFQDGGTTTNGVSFKDIRFVRVQNCGFRSFTNGIRFTDDGTAETHVLSQTIRLNEFVSCTGSGILSDLNTSGQDNNILYENNQFYGCGEGITNNNTTNVNTRIRNNVFEANTGADINFAQASDLDIKDNYFEWSVSKARAINIGNSSSAIEVTGNNFQGQWSSELVKIGSVVGVTTKRNHVESGGTGVWLTLASTNNYLDIERPNYTQGTDPITNTITFTAGGFSLTSKRYIRADIEHEGNITPRADLADNLGAAATRYAYVYSDTFSPGDGTAIWRAGNGSPEGSQSAVVGSLFLRLDGGASTTLYVKESGTGNTGWVAK